MQKWLTCLFSAPLPDAPVKLYRETVLITEDRNLCVKALTHHVPVRDLPAFLRWANIS